MAADEPDRPERAAAFEPGERAGELATLVYDDLRARARLLLARERKARSIRPTDLVHEAYLRLARLRRIDWQGKTHFFALAATEMRRVLVQRARAAKAQKRGAGIRRITLDDRMAWTPEASVDLLALDEALTRLAEKRPRLGRVAEQRVFAGLLLEDIARLEGLTERTVREDWKKARAWLARALRSDQAGDG